MILSFIVFAFLAVGVWGLLPSNYHVQHVATLRFCSSATKGIARIAPNFAIIDDRDDGAAGGDLLSKVRAPIRELYSNVVSNAKTGRKVGENGEIFYFAQLLFIVLGIVKPQFFVQPFLQVFCVTCLIYGSILCFTGISTMGKDLSIFTSSPPSSRLRKEGPFSIVRHPIYSGLVLSALSSAILSDSIDRTLFALLFFWVSDLKASLEEKILEEKFGDDYLQYKAKTAKLVPFIY